MKFIERLIRGKRLPEKQPQAEPSPEDVLRKTMGKFEEPAGIILEKIREDIESGEIGTVVGIDGSGRYPALLLGEIIKRRYKELGHSMPEQKFYRGLVGTRNGGYSESEAKREELMTNTLENFPLKNKDKKILIVDDFTTTGQALEPILLAFKKHGYENIEVASFGSYISSFSASDWEAIKRIREDGSLDPFQQLEAVSKVPPIIEVPIHAGTKYDTIPATRDLTGLTKSSWLRGEEKDKLMNDSYSVRDTRQDSARVALAHRVLKEIADRVFVKYSAHQA